MRFCVKTVDGKYWLGVGGEFITDDENERWILDTKKLAQWQVDNTNLFGELKIIDDNGIRKANL
jgi:hypothetical protein